MLFFLALLILVQLSTSYRSQIFIKPSYLRTSHLSSTGTNELDALKESINNFFKSNPIFAPFLTPTPDDQPLIKVEKLIEKPKKKIVAVIDLISAQTKQLDEQITYHRNILLPVIQRDQSNPLSKQTINHSLKEIEKLLGQRYRLENQLITQYSIPSPKDDTGDDDEEEISVDPNSIKTYLSSTKKMFQSLEGAWRLIYTTGTTDLQQTFSNDTLINYFPLKAIQSFTYSSSNNNFITNGIYWDTFPIIQFQGNFVIDEKVRKVIFDFEKIKLFNILTFNLPTSYNASDFNPNTNNFTILNKKPFFKWILADEVLAIARGRSGGLAIWKRDNEIYSILTATEAKEEVTSI